MTSVLHFDSCQRNNVLEKRSHYFCALRPRRSQKFDEITCDGKSDFRSHLDKIIHYGSILCTTKVRLIREEVARTCDLAVYSIRREELSFFHISTQFVRRQ